MNHHRDARHAPGDASENPRLGTVRVENVKLPLPKKIPQIKQCAQIGKRRNLPYEKRRFHNFDSGVFHLAEQLPFAPFRGAGQQNAFMAGFHKSARGQKCVFLSASDNQPRDEMAYFHNEFSLSV